MTTYKVTFLIVAVVAIFSIPTTESQSFPKRPLSLTPQRYPQPSRNEQDSGPPGPQGSSIQPRRFNYFDQELLKVAAEQIQGNFMISPASIKSTLAMLLEAAKGKAATELRQALRLPEDTNLQRELFKSFLTTTNLLSEGVILQSANRIFLNDQLTPNPEYQDVLKKYYKADVHSTNFGDQQAAVKLINDWISYATEYKITDFISGGDFDPATIMIMANALYFKGNWQVAFEQDATRRRCFYSTGVECRPVNMMEMQSDFNFGYIEALNSNAIEIPYKGDKFSMLIILPKEQGDVSSVVRDLTHVNFKDILNQMSESEVQLSLPRFKIDYESELIPLLKKVGISEVFTPNANLSNIVVGGFQNPQVNSVIHKTHIEVSEKGAVAAAVTGAVVIPLMGTTLEVMNINHPFLFFIRDKTTGAILFGGRVNEPTPYQDSQRAQGQASALAGRRPAAQQSSGRPNIGNTRNPSPQSIQSRPLTPTVYKNPVSNQQDSSNNFNLRNEQQSAGKDQDTFTFSNRGAEAITGGSQQAATTPRYNLRSRVTTTSPPQTYVWQFNEAQDTQNQDYHRRQSEAANQRRAYDQQQKPNVDSQTEQNRQEEHRQINGQVYQNRPNEHGQVKGSKAYAQAARVQPSYSASPQANQQSYTQQSYTQQSYTQQPYYGQYKTTPIRTRRQSLDCTTTHCELKSLPVNEADLRHYREQELKQHQEKLISEENLRQHLEYELKQKQEQELNQQQQQLISEQIYQQHQEEEARQKEINAENLRKSQELERRQIEAQKLNQEERERQELKIKQELEDLAVKQHDEQLRHQEAQAEFFRQNQEHEFQQKVAEEKLLNQQKSQELKQLRAQSLEEHNHRQQLEQELKQKQEQERILQQRQEEEFQLRHQQEQLILEQNLRLQNETQQKEQLIQEENFRIRQEQELKQKQEQELKNQAEKLQYEQNLRQLQEAEQRQIEAQAELIRQIQEIELRQKEAQELKLNKIQGLQQEQSSLSEHQQLVQNPHVSDHNPGQYTAFNPGQSSANNPIQYSNQNLGQNSDFANGGQQYQHQNSFGRRA